MKLSTLSIGSTRRKPVLNLKNRKAPSTPKVLGELVAEAVKVTQELSAMNSPHGRRLTARALFRETLATIQGSPERVARLRSAIEDGEPGFDHTKATLRRMIQFLKQQSCYGAPKEVRRLNFLTTDATNGELASRRNSAVELFCVAVQMASEKHPECFGETEDSAKYAGRMAELTERQRELFEQIVASITADDLLIGEPDSNGRALVSFKMSNGSIPIAPQNDAGERLVNYLIANGKNKN